MIRLKRTSSSNRIKADKLTPQAVLGIMICAKVYEDHAIDMVITSLNDGRHGTNSLHYEGNAWDLRTRNIPVKDLKAVASDLKDALQNDYDVVLESNHIHVEYDPK